MYVPVGKTFLRSFRYSRTMRLFVGIASAGIVALFAGCSLLLDVGSLQGGGDAGPTGADAMMDDASMIDVTASDAGGDASDTGASDAQTTDASDAACSCTNIVSAYLFENPNTLGIDLFGANDMTNVVGNPKQSTNVPAGFTGHSIQLDGSSSVCINTGFTFDSTSDHTLCWWSQPTTLGNSTNQFAQVCGYDTWTTNNGVDYLWRINNCNTGTAANLQVANVYASGKWVQICQTYASAAKKRSVVIDGKVNLKATVTDTVPIVEESSAKWCIGSYGSGGYWTGYIYRPIWFNRVLSDNEIQQVYAKGCCLQ